MQEEKFAFAARAVLGSWTAFQLAIDNQLAGPLSHQKPEELFSATMSYFSTQAARGGGDDWDELAENFDLYFHEEFNLCLEDGSSELVAKHLCKIFTQLRNGVTEEFDRVVEAESRRKPAAPSRAIGLDSSDEDDDDQDDDNDDEDDDMNDDSINEPQGPVFDEDGFELVQRRKR